MRQHQVSLKLSDNDSKRELHQVKALLDLAIEVLYSYVET